MFDDFDDYFCDREDYDGNPGREKVEIAFEEVIKETQKAWLLRFPMKKDLSNEDIWFPMSQCDLDEKNKRIWVPRWLVTEKSIEEYEK